MTNLVFNHNLLTQKSLFWEPDCVNISAWIEHIPFAFWIVETCKPATIVELGVHNGTSYFSFCQAVKTLDLATVCYGIDAWTGDEHAGYYGPEIYNNVTACNSAKFSGFSTLIKSSFDDAVTYFIDNTIDLLHIDGLHTYESVKHDFEVWKRKLSPNAIVIFHDINVRERGFGVFKLWEELKQEYNHLQFNFGHGLGVIALGKDQPEALQFLFNEQDPKPAFTFLKNYFAQKGYFLKSKFENDYRLQSKTEEQESTKQLFAKLEEKYGELNEKVVKTSDEKKTLENNYNSVNEVYAKLLTINEQLRIDHENLHKKLILLELSSQKINEESKELSAQNDLYYNEKESLRKKLTTQEQKFNEISELFSKIVIENNALKDEIELSRKNLAWYRSAYENRSLPGIIKEKLISKRR